MLVRRERAEDRDAVRSIVAEAFARGSETPVEVALVDRLRASDAWIGPLALVAERDGRVVGQVICSRAFVADRPVLGLGPLAVASRLQRAGIGSALMHAVLGAADALDEPLVVLLGHTDYYPRFGFRPAIEFGITAIDPGWGPHLQARALHAYRGGTSGVFRFPPAFANP